MSKILYPNSIRIGLMDPSIAQTWAQRILSDGTTVGSIKKGDTINHTTSQPIATGLFCQRIFGPCIDYTCACGHEKIRIGFNPNIAPPVCPECHVEWTHASVRRQFLGSIDLISPVTHKWFSDSRGAYIPTLLGITPRTFRNLKECKLFFPFDFRKSQESLEYKQSDKKKVNALPFKDPAPLIVRKNLVSTLRAMHSLEFLIDPQKPKNPHFLQNLQLAKNLRGFWFLSNKLFQSGNTSMENLFSKFTDVCMLANVIYFPSTVLAYRTGILSPTVSYKYSIASKTFGKEIFLKNHKTKTNPNKAFSNHKTKAHIFLGENCSKDKNFYSLIAATQWLTIEQTVLLKEKITNFFLKKSKKPVKNLFSSKQKEGQQSPSSLKTNNPKQLKFYKRTLKKQYFNVLARTEKTSLSKEVNLKASPIHSKALESLLVARGASQRVLTQRSYPIEEPTRVKWFSREVITQNFKNDNINFDWKARSLLRETNIEQKKKSKKKLTAIFSPRSYQDNFLKRKNLKYVFVLAKKMKKSNSNVFSESFSTLVLQNKPVSLNSGLESQTLLNNEEQNCILANFYENVRTNKSQNKIKTKRFPTLSKDNSEALPFPYYTSTSIERQNTKIGIKASSLIGRNGTYIFRDFIKFKKEGSPEILFGKNKAQTQLFAKHSINRAEFGSKIQNFITISSYKIRLLANSKVGLCMTDSSFTFNLLLPKKNTWNISKTTFISIFSQSGNQRLLNKDKERLFSYLQCRSLLRTTGTKLCYLQEKERLTSFVLKAFFYGFKTIKPALKENLKETRSLRKTWDLLAFNMFSFCPKYIYLINLLSNLPLKEPQNREFQTPTPDNSSQILLKNVDGFAKHHNFPIRPSYTQPEDYRRQFIKFLGHNSLIENTDVPIFRYLQKRQLTNQGFLDNFVKDPFKTKSNRSFRSPQAIEVYFSEAKSVAKEQTIKKILSQTGGGGLQTCLELVNLSELVLILQNDLSEIAPRLSKSQSTRRVLLSIINDASNSLTEALLFLKKSTNNQKNFLPFSANQEKLFVASAPGSRKAPATPYPNERGQKEEPSTILFNKEQEDYSSKTSSVNFKKLQDREKTALGTSKTLLNDNILLHSSTTAQINQKGKLPGDATRDLHSLSTGETKETYYPNHVLIIDKIEVLEKKCKDVKKEYKAVKKICNDFQNRKNAHKRRYKLAFQLLRTMSNPAGMTMSSVPVLPPGLRPIIDVPKIGPITADLNIRYRSLLFALRNLRELAYVDFRNAGAAQASVQEAVDDLLYTGGKTRREKPSSQNPNLYKSLAMRLKGKHGRFRGNLLGKRVDYSGRSVIVVGPTLKIHQCGLPFEIAIKLFNPFLIRSLIQRGFCKNVYKAKQILIRGKFKPLIWTLCQEVMSEHLVLLNRAPTLHRLGVQAFMPVLISGRAILLHPLVCTGFNADFDGDQMGVHVPLFPQARAEAWKMMWSRNNFLLPSSGEPVLLPSQDMVLGCYYLTCSTQKVLQTVLENPKYNNSLSFPFSILNQQTALNGYSKGTYNIQSVVWINLIKTTFLKPYAKAKQDERLQKKQTPFISWNREIQKTEDDGLVAATLELRITPFGIMRLIYTGGIKSFNFQNSLLGPGRQAGKPPVFAVVIRTTIGRLIFNNLLEDIKLR